MYGRLSIMKIVWWMSMMLLDEPEALTPLVKGKVILTVHQMEGYDFGCRSIFLGGNPPGATKC
jgi:hypothetical protein